MKTISFKYFLLVAALLTSSGIFISSCSEDDDGQPDVQNLPKMTFQDYTLEEADIDQTVTINLSLEGVASANGVVSFLVAGGTAEAGIDYEIKTSSPLVFTEGET
ncbi:MAG TPA: hypothetical protein PLQ57_10805, partial [Saprospiraceae bacterium]|nr:hypothetical protein [Saprospiraceae bacterium]